MKRIFSKRAQTITEIALILATVGLVFIGMEIYVRRGVQSRIKSLTDNMIGTEQYEYTVDVSGYDVIDSNASSSGSSRVTTQTLTGGAKNTSKSESISATSTSHSEYSP
jgi:hypothetical protein